eukprot:scaffold41383_cov63-Phaeocystis_antarctica.AAC.4
MHTVRRVTETVATPSARQRLAAISDRATVCKCLVVELLRDVDGGKEVVKFRTAQRQDICTLSVARSEIAARRCLALGVATVSAKLFAAGARPIPVSRERREDGRRSALSADG